LFYLIPPLPHKGVALPHWAIHCFFLGARQPKVSKWRLDSTGMSKGKLQRLLFKISSYSKPVGF